MHANFELNHFSDPDKSCNEAHNRYRHPQPETPTSFAYPLPEDVRALTNLKLMTALLTASDAVGRLDEKLAASPIAGGIAERLILQNARAAMHARHRIVYLEELVLFDAHAYDGPVHTEIAEAGAIVHSWRCAARADPTAVLRATIPGDPSASIGLAEHDPDVAAVFDPDHKQTERLAAWRDVLKRTETLPPVLAAAIAWDAWLALTPEVRGDWRGSLIAALILKTHGKSRNLLLPLDLGVQLARYRWEADDTPEHRIRMLIDSIGTTARQAYREHDTLRLAEQLLRRKLANRRRNSKLPALIDLVLSRPLITRRMVATTLGVSKQAAAVMIDQLGPTLRELTDRRSYRCWGL